MCRSQNISETNGLADIDLCEKTIVDMSTIDADSSARAAKIIYAKRGHFLRDPVTGSVHYTREGTLGIMVSRKKEIYEQCKPYFEVLGNRCIYLEQGEESKYSKITINIMLGHILQFLSEG